MKDQHAAAGGRAARMARYDLPNHGLSLFVAEATSVAVEAEWRHLASRTAATSMGRLMIATALASGFLEGAERLTLQIRAPESPLRGLTAEADATGNLRAYVSTKSIPELDSGDAGNFGLLGGKGWILALRANDESIQHQGTTELAKRDVTSDVLRVLRESEQRVCHLGVVSRYDGHLRQVTGVLAHALHDLDVEVFDHVGKVLANVEQLEAHLADTDDFDEVLRRILPSEVPAHALRTWVRPLQFRCRCSREKVRGMLISMGSGELDDMIQRDKGARVTCHFCNDEYTFDADELRTLAERIRKALSSPSPSEAPSRPPSTGAKEEH